jgi:Glutaminase
MEKFGGIFKQNLLTLLTVTSFVGFVYVLNSCKKNTVPAGNTSQLQKEAQVQTAANQILSQNVTVAAVRPMQDGSTQALFLQNEEILNFTDVNMAAQLNTALRNNVPLHITYNPWQGTLLSVSPLVGTEAKSFRQQQASNTAAQTTGVLGNSFSLAAAGNNFEHFDNPAAIGIMNTTTGSLVGEIPNIATAQQMFNYLTSQCCALPGPYTVDYCISFQYCEDGCYARAHKMCYIINNKYNYATHKVFSFANVSPHSLSVKAEKWGGCCINWWYHVAPLVTVNTPTGPKAYVFDPAMFDQPVLLSVWLNAQKNPACSGNAAVDMINIQPTTAYSPATYSGTSFDTDPDFSSTDTTMVHYSMLKSCP